MRWGNERKTRGGGDFDGHQQVVGDGRGGEADRLRTTERTRVDERGAYAYGHRTMTTTTTTTTTTLYYGGTSILSDRPAAAATTPSTTEGRFNERGKKILAPPDGAHKPSPPVYTSGSNHPSSVDARAHILLCMGK